MRAGAFGVIRLAKCFTPTCQRTTDYRTLSDPTAVLASMSTLLAAVS